MMYASGWLRVQMWLHHHSKNQWTRNDGASSADYKVDEVVRYAGAYDSNR